MFRQFGLWKGVPWPPLDPPLSSHLVPTFQVVDIVMSYRPITSDLDVDVSTACTTWKHSTFLNDKFLHMGKDNFCLVTIPVPTIPIYLWTRKMIVLCFTMHAITGTDMWNLPMLYHASNNLELPFCSENVGISSTKAYYILYIWIWWEYAC